MRSGKPVRPDGVRWVWRLSWLPRDFQTSVPNWGLKTTDMCSLPVPKARIPKSRRLRADLRLEARGEGPPGSASIGGLQASLGLWPHHTSFCLCPPTPTCVSVCPPLLV